MAAWAIWRKIIRTELSPLLELFEELLAKLSHFGLNDNLAVGLTAVACEVVLVVILGSIEYVKGRNLCHNRILPDSGGFDFADHLFSHLLLLRRMIEDDRPILSADIGALTVERGRIVNRERLALSRKLSKAGSKVKLYDLGVPGVAAANLAIGGILHGTAGVP